MNSKELLEKIIRGQDLAQEEASSLMEDIMDGKLTSAQIGAFLVALRMKKETVDEITGFAVAMRKRAKTIQTKHPIVVDTCGTGGDGAKTFNISTIAAFVAAGAGVPIAKHGNVAVSSLCGSANLLEGLGVKVDAETTIMEKALNEIGICFLYAPLYHHSMQSVSGPRKEIGVRTVFNILGPLTNPVRAKAQVLGIFSEKWIEPLAYVLRGLGTQEAFIVHGGDGLDEITTTRETHIVQLKNSVVTRFEFKPEIVGIKKGKMEDLKGGNAECNINICKSILEGQKGPKRDIVIINAAFVILVSGMVSNIHEAVEKANIAIDSGLAHQKLLDLIKYTNR